MYSLKAYGEMLTDSVRMDAYSAALRAVIRPGSVVVDIGTGAGIMSLLACQMGARRVFAIEPEPVIQLARRIAAENGFADRIEFLENISSLVTLPEKADIIVSDLRGALPFFGRHIPSIIDARERFLCSGGCLIPKRDELWAAVIEAPNAYSETVSPWEQNSFGFNLGTARQMALHSPLKARAPAEQLLSSPQSWFTLDYHSVESADAEGSLHWTAERKGTGRGLIVWFDTVLADGIGFSNAPAAPEAIYQSLFFPWPQPVSLSPGDRIDATLQAKLIDEDYTWRWTTRISSPEKSSEPRHVFDQSTLQGAFVSPAALRKTASDFVPSLSEEGRIHARALALMDGNATLEEIARDLAAEFPRRFRDWYQALRFAGAISSKHSR